MMNEMSRRSFLKLISGSSLLGLGAMVAGCGKETGTGNPQGGAGWMPDAYETAGRWPAAVRGRVAISRDNPSIVREDETCILCGQCVEICDKVMSIHGHYPLPLKLEQPCVHCGQCTIFCPTGAITERTSLDPLRAALDDPEKVVVVQTAPSTKVSLGEAFGLAPGALDDGAIVAALHRLGFDAVFDTCSSADLTIMEEASEFLERLRRQREKLPHFTSCCPAWVKFCEYFYPEHLSHLSTTKSPQQIMGAVLKDAWAKKKGICPASIVVVSVMPCTAKKFEAVREENGREGRMDVDIVLTVRELARLLKEEGVAPAELSKEPYDPFFGESTDAGRIFGATGGVAEASLRTLFYLATGKRPPSRFLEWKTLRGLGSVKEAAAVVPALGTVRVAVCHGLGNARSVMEEIKAGHSRWDFIEFMACPGGCIGGGGQPRTAFADMDALRRARIEAIYAVGARARKRASFENEEVAMLYREAYGRPLSEASERVLHTSFIDRSTRIAGGERGV